MCSDNKCSQRKTKDGIRVEITKEKDNCRDKNRKTHLKIKVGNFTGDACCSTDKIHMIRYDDHCCSVSNTPFIVHKRDLTPKCCGREPENNLQYIQYGNGVSFWSKNSSAKAGIAFCRDNLSGSWTQSYNLNEDRIYFGNPLTEYNSQTKKQEPVCCQNVTNKEFAFDSKTHPNDRGCCSSRAQRFKEKADQKQECCVYTGRCYTENMPCCEGKCTRTAKDNESSKDAADDYWCVTGVNNTRMDRRTSKCKD
jgi:hypothetical protein